MTQTQIHPRDALMQGALSAAIPACEHYAGTERFIRKAFELQASMNGRFDVTIDLEDGAQVGREREHLDLAMRLLHEHARTPGRRGVRIHPADHPFAQDEIIALTGPSAPRIEYITLPKAQSAAQTAHTWEQVARRAGPSTPLKLHVLIETHAALHDVWEIAALPAVESLDFGLMDFISAHNGAIPAAAMRSPLQFEHELIIHAKCAVAQAAAAHGKVAAHNVCVDIDRPEQARADAKIARDRYGFLRMWSIHPAQIAPILEALAPRQDEIDEAVEILTQAQEHAWAPIALRGRLHDRGSYRYYWTILERAATAGAPLADEIQRRFFPQEAASR